MKKTFKLITLTFFAALTAAFSGCKKDSEPPTLNTGDVFVLASTYVEISGVVTSDGGAQVIARGVCWNTSHNPTVEDNKTLDGTGTGYFSSSITGLSPNATYYVRAYATNREGTSYGNEVAFTSKAITLTRLTTASIKVISSSSAISGGYIISDGGDAITDRGICLGTTQLPTIDGTKIPADNSYDSFTSNLTGLNPGTIYFVRAYAVNGAGLAYGNQLSFTSGDKASLTVFKSGLAYGSVSDIDGNNYKTIQIGKKIWIAENLRTVKFNDGTTIPDVTGDADWVSLTTPGYCWYNNDAYSNKDAYGALYNWYVVEAASNGGKNICPDGWHVSSGTEWAALITFLGGEAVAGGKLKETGTSHWLSSDDSATNESGFTALPGGLRDPLNEWFEYPFGYIGSNGTWWSTTKDSPRLGVIWTYSESSDISSGMIDDSITGRSVRCVKD